jgi:hypothetical protein
VWQRPLDLDTSSATLCFTNLRSPRWVGSIRRKIATKCALTLPLHRGSLWKLRNDKVGSRTEKYSRSCPRQEDLKRTECCRCKHLRAQAFVTRYAAASASKIGLPSLPPISGSTRSSGCGMSPSTRKLGDKMPPIERALPLRFAVPDISPAGVV